MTISHRVLSANKIVARDVQPGMQPQTTLTLSSGAATPVYGSHVIAAESGTADNFDTVTLTNLRAADVVEWTVDTGDTITFTNGVGNITTDTGSSIVAIAGQTVRCKVNAAADGVVASLVGSAVADAFLFKGVIDCSANPDYPAADAGHTYRVSVAGKIGGASGPNVEVGDLLTCTADGTASGDHATVGSSWTITQANLDGAVIGPASAASGNLPSFDGTTGKLLNDSGFKANGAYIDGSTVAADGNGEITVAPRRRYQLTASDSIAGVIGLADGEFVQIIAPASGSATLEDAGTTTAGQALELSGADKIIQSTDEVVYTLTRVGSAIRLSGGAGSGAGAETVSSKAVMTALSTSGLTAGDRRYVNGQGLFTWDSSNLSTEVGYDDGTTAGVYLPPDSDATGASGAWVREEYIRGKIVRPEWFGAVADGTTSDHVAFQDMVDFATAVGGTTWHSATPPPIILSSKDYHIETTVVFAETFEAPSIFGNGLGSIISGDDNVVFQFNTDMRSTGWPTTDWSDTTPFDANGTSTITGLHIEGVMFACRSSASTNSCALLLQRVIDARIINCRFKDWFIHVDCHRLNRVHFIANRHYGSGRTAASEAHIRFQGLHDTVGGDNAGGGVHIIDCEFQGEMDGGGANTSYQSHIIKVHSIDGLYISNTHFTLYDRCFSVEPSAEDHNKTTIDIRLSNTYFDNVADNGRDFELTGTVDAGSLMQDFHFDQCYFRGANLGGFGFVGSVDDGGSFAGTVDKIVFSNCQFKDHKTTAVNIIGSASSKVEIADVKLANCVFDEGRHVGTGGSADVLYDGSAITIIGCTFLESTNAPNQNISINTVGESENDVSIIVTNNDFSRATYSSGYMQLSLSDKTDRVVMVQNNVKKPGDNTQYDFERDGRGTFTPAITWSDIGTTGVTYSNQDGWYRRQGDIVTIAGRIILSAKGSPGGGATMKITGLPFTALNEAALRQTIEGQFGAMDGTDDMIFEDTKYEVVSNTTEIQPKEANASGTGFVNMDETHVTDTSTFWFSGQYIIET